MVTTTLDWMLKKLEARGGFWLYAGTLLAVMFLAYGAQVGRLGYYYDDWEGIFLYKLNFSAAQIWQYFLTDRPFSALVHILYNPLFGAAPLGWHVWGIVLNWAAILLIVRTLLSIWPEQVTPIGWIGLLAALYPGLTRQFVIKTSMPHYTSLLLFALSVLLMVKAYQTAGQRKGWLVSASVALGVMQVLIIEYFSGLELARFFVLLYLARRDSATWAQTLGRAIRNYLPYALIFGVFVVYRFALLPAMQLEGMAADHEVSIVGQLLANPSGTLIAYANRIAQDVWYAIVYVWTLSIQPQEIEFNSKSTLASWGLGLMAGLAAALAMEAWARKAEGMKRSDAYPALIFAAALGAILVGGLPAWMTGKQALVGLWSGRFLFGQFLGAVSVTVLVVMWFIGRERRAFAHLAMALLLVNAFSLQFRTANKYALDWGIQRDFFWQLKWRVPALEPRSFIVMANTPLALTVDYQLAFVINMLYGSPPGQETVDYWWFNAPNRLPGYFARAENPTQAVEIQFRTIRFASDMSRAVPVLYRPSRGCLLVADPVYASAPLLSDAEQKMFADAYAANILTDDVPVPRDVFGSEPPRGWCYHFQKADLARQNGQWDTVLEHWRTAQAAGLSPSYGPEYIPFIEAYARQEDWDTARQLTEASFALSEKMDVLLCNTWLRVRASTPASAAREAAWEALQPTLNCINARR